MKPGGKTGERNTVMVGPLSSEEIEDVVSSVRRLVSNEQNPRRVTRDLSAERLLLTPALRVVSEVSPLSPLILQAPLVEAAEPAVAEADVVIDPHVTDAPMVELIEADWEDEIWAAPEAASLGEVALGAEEAELLVAPVEVLAEEAQVVADNGVELWSQPDHEWTEEADRRGLIEPEMAQSKKIECGRTEQK